MLAVFKKEFRNYFLSPIGYVFIGFCLIMCSIFFYMTAISQGVTNYEYMFFYVAQIFVFITPILTMRMFAEERKNGTEILLFTSPKSTTSIVLGKLLASLTVVFIMELLTLVYFIILCYFGMPQISVALATLAGILLLAFTFISIGMLISTLTENQIIAGISTIGIFMALWFLPSVDEKFSKISILEKFFSIPNGNLVLSDIVALITTGVACVVITIILLERRKLLK